MAQPRDPTAIPPEPIRARISYLRRHCERYVGSDRGTFPTPEEQALLEVVDFVLGAPSNQRKRVAQRLSKPGSLRWLVAVAGGRFTTVGNDFRSLHLLRAGIVCRAITAHELTSDIREVVQGIPGSKDAIRLAGGDPDAMFGEVKALFPGRPAELLDYYGARPPGGPTRSGG
jgi:hypothetical protein